MPGRAFFLMQAPLAMMSRLRVAAGSIFPPGWWSFTLRIWAALVLALLVAFWAQIDSPASAAVTVMLLAQPLRGQALSKAFYRVVGTLVGGVVALCLVSMFGQERQLLLGGCAVWMAICAYAGTLRRGFRAYGAVLSGYVVALIAISHIDAPQNAFDITVARVSTVMIGVAAIATVALLSGTPHVWQRLVRSLQKTAAEVRHETRLALDDTVPTLSPLETIALSSTVFALTHQVHDTRTELTRGRLRAKGAQVCLIGMVTALSCCRSLLALMRQATIAPAVLALTRFDIHAPSGTDRETILADLLGRLPPEAPRLTLADAWRLERTASLIASRHISRKGLNTLLKAAPLGQVKTMSRFAFHPDRIAALVNAIRVLLCFSAAAALFIGSGLPNAATALSQCAMLLCLGITQPNSAAFGRGILIGTPLGILTAGLTSFFILPHVNTMMGMAIVMLFQVMFSCLLIINPATAAAGSHYGAFFFVFLGLNNHHDYNLLAFVDRNTFYLCAAGITAFFLILFLPPRPRRTRFRITLSIARELERQFAARSPSFTPALLSRKYDRLHQLYMLSQTISQEKKGKAAWRVCQRFISLADLTTALARLELDLKTARQYTELAPLADTMQRSLTRMKLFSLADHLPLMAEKMLSRAPASSGPAHVAAVLCAAGLEEVRFLLQQNGSALRHYGIGRRRW
ncbi:FUSC family protein [Parasaccharibacter sp. TMW 2.1886]|nr:FUSC family protein [Parasaccharibacter sp. TMW 2.1886]